MTPAEISDFISKVGFPIAAAVGLSIVLWGMVAWFKRTGDLLAARFITHIDSTDKEVAEIKPALERIDKTTGQTFELLTRPASSGS